ncbi:MAG TPA: hypothetical protein VE420_14760 [Gemmatimonadales bacterium]|nr:hypothetical protein [Gemmatimonadales bacterium]
MSDGDQHASALRPEWHSGGATDHGAQLRVSPPERLPHHNGIDDHPLARDMARSSRYVDTLTDGSVRGLTWTRGGRSALEIAHAP